MTRLHPTAALVLASGLLGIAALIAYAPGLPGPLLLDDFFHIQPLITPGVPEPAHWWAPLAGHAGPTGRPIAMLSFVAQAYLHGADLWYWKFANVLLHLGAGALLGYVVLLVCATRPDGAGRHDRWIALLVAGLWLVHPLQISSVLYLVQRMTLLAAFFTLAAIALYLRARVDHARGHRRALPLLLAAWFAALPLALFSKETGVLIPVFFLAIEWTLWRRHGGIAAWPALRMIYAGAALLAVMAASLAFTTGFVDTLRDAYASRPFSVGERLLTQARVWWLYVAQVLFPAPGLFGFLHNDLVVSTGLLAPPTTLIALVGWLAVGVLIGLLRDSDPILAFALAWFLIGHSLEGTVLPLEMMFEHRNYLPSAGLLLALVWSMSRLAVAARVRVGLGLTALVVLAVLTRWHASQWRDEQTLYAYILRHHPQSSWAVGMAAEWLSQRGAHAQARALLADKPGIANALHGLSVDCRAGMPIRAARLERLRSSIEIALDGYAGQVLAGFAQLVLDDACEVPIRALNELLDGSLEQRFATGRSRFKIHLLRARLAQRAADLDTAIAQLESAHAQRPEDPMALLLAAEFLAEAGRYAQARAYLARAREITAQSAWNYDAVVDAVAAMLPQASRQ